LIRGEIFPRRRGGERKPFWRIDLVQLLENPITLGSLWLTKYIKAAEPGREREAGQKKDNDCPGKTFCLVETNPDGKSGVAACSLCGFLVGVIDDGVAPSFDELIDTSSTRPFVVRLRFVKGATELRKVSYTFVSLSDAEKFSRAIEKRFGAELSANGATGFDMQMFKDGVQLGQTKVFVK